MIQRNNRLCRAIVPNNNPKSKFFEFELITVREYNDYNGGTYLEEVKTATDFLDDSNAYDEPFYRIFGLYRNKIPKKSRFIADFLDINEARSFLQDLTGEEVHVISY
jgi:hypothetical protein